MNIVNKENLQRFFEGLKSKFVRTVNHQQMDENGNIDITHVESASNIVSSQDQVLSSTFTYRTTGGSTSINSGNATLIKLKGNTQLIDGTYVSTKPTSFESTGFNAFNNLSNSMVLSDATITVVDGTATITQSTGNIVCYCPCVCGITDYIAYDSNCHIIMSGTTESLPQIGSTVTEIGTNLEPPQTSNYTTKSIISPSGSGAKYIVIALYGAIYSQLQIHPRWSGKADETTEDYVAPSTITFPTQGLLDGQTTNLPSWGLAKVNNTFDEMNIEDHVYIQRIGRETTSDSITSITSWEQGNISTVDGTDESSEFSCRTTEFYNFTNVPEGITLLIEDGYEVKAFIYSGESTDDYVSSTNSMIGTVVLLPLDTQYYCFTIAAIQEDETPIPLAPTDLSNDSLKFNERPPVSNKRIRDNTYDYYVLDEPITYSISINGTYVANDYGTERFIFGEGVAVLDVPCEMLYGQNLVDKLRTDVLTISEQTLSSSQQSQVKSNLGIIEYLPTVLYENSSGALSLTLSESSANFKFLEILYKDNFQNTYQSTKVYSPNGKMFSAITTLENASPKTFYTYSTTFQISGTSIQSVRGGQANARDNATSYVQYSGAGGDYCKARIVCVLGYKALSTL